jgi:hypothetical protein
MANGDPIPDWWARTVGGARLGDPRDGELHACFGTVRDRMDLEPWDDSADQNVWRYVRDPCTPAAEKDGRPVHTFRYRHEA